MPTDPVFPLVKRTAFRERRRLSNGPTGWALVIVGAYLVTQSFILGGAWTLPLLVLAATAIAVGTTFSIDLLVTSGEARVVWWRLFVRHRLPVREIESIDTVLTDNLVAFFGGYNSRTSREGAVTRSMAGERSVGTMAVRIQTNDGRTVQVGCWQPTRFRAAVEATRNG